MLELVHSLFGDRYFTQGCLLRLLDEAVEHHWPFADQGSAGDAGDAYLAFQAQLKEALAKSLAVRITQVWTQRDHAPCQDPIPRSQGVGQIKDRRLYLRAVVTGAVIPGRIITNMLFSSE